MIIFKNITSWTVPDLFDIPFKLIIYILLVNSIEKYEFGILSLAMMIFSYHALSQVGVMDWLMYELPKKYSQNKDMSRLIASSHTFALINQVALFLVLVGLYIILGVENSLLLIACTAYILQTFIYNSYVHQKLFLRFQHQFSRLLKVQLTFIFLKFSLQFLALYFWGIFGYLLVEATLYLIPIYLFRNDLTFSLIDKSWRKHYFQLLFNGLPYFAVVLVSILISNIDRWFVIWAFGVESFATYSLGVFLITALLIVPGKVLSIFSQYMKEMHTSENNTPRSIARCFSVNNLLIYLGICLLFIFWELSLKINLVFPEYGELVPLVQTFLVVTIVKYAVSLSTNVLYLIERRIVIVRIQIFVFAIYIFALAVGMWSEFDLKEIIWVINVIFLFNLALNLIAVKASVPTIASKKMYQFFAQVSGFAVVSFLVEFNSYGVIIYLYFLPSTVLILSDFSQTWHDFKYIANRNFEKKPQAV